jgi:hypothetical protein
MKNIPYLPEAIATMLILFGLYVLFIAIPTAILGV